MHNTLNRLDFQWLMPIIDCGRSGVQATLRAAYAALVTRTAWSIGKGDGVSRDTSKASHFSYGEWGKR